ncbi:hypothetical protein ACSBPH_08380 [Microbacterium sp. F51-2R]|uniref:hypothetical protein n=1 Tax=Microbacterium sp. F51-2R TaxID=3445777 RepID=UPI003FA0FD53
MSEATCAVLTAIFPLVLLTVVLERRTIHLNIRRAKWFRRTTMSTVAASLVGLPLTVVGVQLHGLDWNFAWIAWLVALVAFLGLAFNLIGAAASEEAREDGDAAPET